MTKMSVCLYLSVYLSACLYHSACVWPTTLKLGCVTNFDMLFLLMGFTSLVDEIKFMLISSQQFL